VTRFHILFVGSLVAARCVSAERTVTMMNQADRRVAEEFAGFEKDHDVASVHRALEMVEAATRDAAAGNTAAVERAMSLWLHFFATLDRAIDPRWDVRDVPVRGAPPPPSHGNVYPSGEVDPRSIADPAARARYEQALKASEDYRRWYNVQFQLRRIEEDAMRLIGRMLAARYKGSDEDKRELERLLSGSLVDDLRKERIRALMPHPG